MTWTSEHRIGADGLRWRIREAGTPRGFPLFLLHGFTGDATYWSRIAAGLPGRRVLAPDLPGHGGTDAPFPPEEWRLPRLARALGTLLDALGVTAADWVGYSMGGRAALHAALGPDAVRIRRLVLVGASPGIPDPAERARRADEDRQLAERIVAGGIEAFVDAWERLPLFAGEARLAGSERAAVRARRLAQDPRGLAAALLAFGPGFQEDLGPRLGEVALPTLLVAGALDAKYVASSSETASRIPAARASIVEGAGHSVPLEDPEGLLAVLRAFHGDA